MIETNMQHEQQDTISQQQSYPHTEAEAQEGVGTGPTITCSICDAVYAPAPQQVLFLQDEQRALEATFMGMCHFCFRCRHAACPQCWDEVHGVCGSCVLEAGLPFRAPATPLDGLMFPPTAQATYMPAQPQSSSLFVPVRNGRFYRETEVKPESAPTNITTEHTPAFQPAVAHASAHDSQITDRHTDDANIAFDTTKTGENHATKKDPIDTPAALAVPVKTPVPDDAQETRGREKAPRIAKKAKKASRLEVVITWIVLVIVLALVVVIALAEFIPAVNAAIARVTHIDIHGEIAYLVHIVQQLFKK